MKSLVLGWLLKWLPKNLMSYWIGRLMSWHPPKFLKRPLLLTFANYYHIDLYEAEHSLADYHSIQELFTRRLRTGIRPIGTGVIHPVDGRLTQSGLIEADQMIQAKGFNYSVSEFLAAPEMAPGFSGGTYLTYYLCPTDYHRVHAPIEGRLVRAQHIPGTLWPVNEWSVTHVPKLFARNERVVIWIETAYGLVAVVMVGATNVGQMAMSFDSEFVTNRPDLSPPGRVRDYEPPILLNRGQELGVFRMGSTVIVLYPPQFPTGYTGYRGGVQMGESLASGTRHPLAGPS